MDKILNVQVVRDAMEKLGLNQSQLSSLIGVSRTSVTKWLSGHDFPRPAKLLGLGELLDLSFNELVIELPSISDPVIAFRRKRQKKTQEKDIERAKHMGILLRDLTPLLPFNTLTRPAILRDPVNNYGYLQEASRRVRDELGLQHDRPIKFKDLVDHFVTLHAVIIPVLWGKREYHENALHIYLPDSMTTWIYINLDSKIHDFNFWMAHELGHALAPNLRDNEGEDFADAFAQALLFPERCAANAYNVMTRLSEGARVNHMKDIAQQFCISPTTVNLALRSYAQSHEFTRVDVGDSIHPATTNFSKEQKSLSEILFTEIPPAARDYIVVASTVFETPFFDALKKYVQKGSVSTGFVEQILQLPFVDAKGIISELKNVENASTPG